MVTSEAGSACVPRMSIAAQRCFSFAGLLRAALTKPTFDPAVVLGKEVLGTDLLVIGPPPAGFRLARLGGGSPVAAWRPCPLAPAPLMESGHAGAPAITPFLPVTMRPGALPQRSSWNLEHSRVSSDLEAALEALAELEDDFGRCSATGLAGQGPGREGERRCGTSSR